MSDTHKSIITEIALHLLYDADVNGSKLAGKPYGNLAITYRPGSLWKRATDMASKNTGSLEEYEILLGLLREINYNAEPIANSLEFFGSLDLEACEGSTWKMVLDVLGYEPEMIRDVVGPAIRKRLAGPMP